MRAVVTGVLIVLVQASAAAAGPAVEGTPVKQLLVRRGRMLDDGAALPRVGSAVQSWHQGERALGDWWGVRSQLEGWGLAIESNLVVDWSKPLAGGVRGRDVVRGVLDVVVAVDLGAILGIPGGTLFAQAYGQRGREGGVDTVDAQGYSNIDSEDRTQVAELFTYPTSSLYAGVGFFDGDGVLGERRRSGPDDELGGPE